ncbi:MAG TPA: extracellular solute-binding protein, partial [Lachnospiraceae bacterium]
PKTIEAMQQLEQAIKDGVMPSLETMSENGEDVLFTSGKVAMVPQGSWMIAAYRDNEYTAANCDVVELPKSKTTGRRVSLYNGLGWAAAANGEHTEEAWKLLEYLGSKEAQQKQAELGVTMAAYKGISDAWTKSANFNLQAYLNMTEDMVIRPYSKSTVTWENKTNELLQKVYTGEASMEDTMKELAKFMNDTIAEE